MSNAIPDDMRDFLMDAGRSLINEGMGAPEAPWIPTLILENSEGQQVLFLDGDAHPFERVLTVLPVLFDMHPLSISLTVDSYAYIGEVEDATAWEATRASYGYDLGRMFQAGEPGVTECLSILYVTKTNDWSIMMPYERQAEGPAVWGETTESMGARENHGRMVELLRAAFGILPEGGKL
jgi:hypothetical protein